MIQLETFTDPGKWLMLKRTMDHKSSLSRLKNHREISIIFQIARAISGASGSEVVLNDPSHFVQIGLDFLILDLPHGFCLKGDRLKVTIQAQTDEASYRWEILASVDHLESDHLNAEKTHARLGLISSDAQEWRTLIDMIEEKQKDLNRLMGKLRE